MRNNLTNSIYNIFCKIVFETEPPTFKEFEKSLKFKAELETIIKDQQYDEISYVVVNKTKAIFFETFNNSENRCINLFLREVFPGSWSEAIKEGYEIKKIKVLINEEK